MNENSIVFIRHWPTQVATRQMPESGHVKINKDQLDLGLRLNASTLNQDVPNLNVLSAESSVGVRATLNRKQNK